MRRRTFIQSTAGAAMAAPATVSAAQGAAGPGLRLGFDTYSVRAYGWKAIRLLDFAAEMKTDTIQFSDFPNFESTDAAYLQRVKDHAARLGIHLDSGLGCICDTAAGYRKELGDVREYILSGLRVAHAIGATCMRCYMGGGSERTGAIPLEKHIERTVQTLRSVRSQALDLNVKIAVENHMDLQAKELRTLIEEAGKDFVAACLDTGNPISVVEDPMLTLEVLAPYTVTTHIKDFVIFEHPRGAVTQLTALGDGSMDYVKFFNRFRQLCPSATVQLESLSGSPPRVVPYLEPDFWKPFANTSAADFSRFVALAKDGHPFMGSMMIGSREQKLPEYQAALDVQQRVDLARGLDYARKVLNVGIRR